MSRDGAIPALEFSSAPCSQLSGNEIGPFKAIEESTLAQLIESDHRSTIFAWYAVFSGLAGALGSLSGGWITQVLQQQHGWSNIEAYRMIFWMYTVWGLVKSLLTLCLSKACEVETKPKLEEEQRLLPEQGLLPEQQPQGPVESAKDGAKRRGLGFTSETRKKVWLLSALFGLDNIASGLVPL